MKVNLGKIKVWFDVAKYYYAVVMQTITGVGVLKLLGLSWFWLILMLIAFIPIIVFAVYLHMKYVYPKEVEYTWTKNPVVRKHILNKEHSNE